jgi:predicted MFS family arabinose efflux permease
LSSHGTEAARAGSSALRQPKGVWAVAFACVISFMGIGLGLVDPIQPSLAGKSRASPSQVELLFTGYLVVTAVAMPVTGWVSSRIGAKYTLISGLVLIVVLSTVHRALDAADRGAAVDVEEPRSDERDFGSGRGIVSDIR